jgi:hypothetical protein
MGYTLRRRSTAVWSKSASATAIRRSSSGSMARSLSFTSSCDAE